MFEGLKNALGIKSQTSIALESAIKAQTEEFQKKDPVTDGSLSEYIDPVDSLPDNDNAVDRDHFPDETTDQEIDTMIAAMNADPDGIKTGRYKIFERDPDNDPDNFNDDDPDSDDPDSDF